MMSIWYCFECATWHVANHQTIPADYPFSSVTLAMRAAADPDWDYNTWA